MNTIAQDNKRIARNTIMLYMRMLVLMAVNLYTSRLLINALGVKDYGLYSVVGSVVLFLSFLNNSMTAASQRYLTYTKGNGTVEQQKSMFCSVFVAQLIIALTILLIAETLGIYYIINYLNVSADKYIAAHWVFQFSLASLLIKTITIPYHASIIANERMGAFAAISLIEGSLQLFAVLVLFLFDEDKIIYYGAFMFLSIFVTQSAYILYSKIKFKECKLSKSWKGEDVKNIFEYSGWNLFGAVSSVFANQGVNMLLNSFFGVVVNAARGIAVQIEAAITSLSGNFQSAINPQVIKKYAIGDYERMHKMMMVGTRFSYFLLLLFAMPIYTNIDSILVVWLKIVPESASEFCRLTLIFALIASLSGLLLTGAMATGKIRKYQIIVGTINLLNLPISFLFLKVTSNVCIPYYVSIVIGIIAFITRLVLVSKMINLSKKLFFKDVLFPICISTIVLAVCLYCVYLITVPSENVLSLITNIIICFIVTLFIIYFLGTKKEERFLIKNYIRCKYNERYKIG